jgi:hypothetical protein
LAYYVGTDDWTDGPEYAGTTIVGNVGRFITRQGIRSEKSLFFKTLWRQDLVVKYKGGNCLGDLSVDGRIILK